MCLGGERAVDAVLRVIPGLGRGVQSGKKRVLGPLFKIDLHLLHSLFKKEQLIHRRLRHTQAPGTFPAGELSDPCFCSWTAPLAWGLGLGAALRLQGRRPFCRAPVLPVRFQMEGQRNRRESLA